MAADFTPRGPEAGELPVIGEIDVRLAHWLPGKPARGTPLTAPFDKNNHWLGPGASREEGQSHA